MRFPRFRLRTLMIAVALVGLLLAAIVHWPQRPPSGNATVLHFVNRTSAPLELWVTYSAGVVNLKPLMPGTEVEWQARVSAPENLAVQLTKTGFSMRHRAKPSGGYTIITFHPADRCDRVTFWSGDQ